MTPQPQHCDHECVCMGYCNCHAALIDEPCPKPDCDYDTRSRPHTQAPDLHSVLLKTESEIAADKLNEAAYTRGKIDGAKAERDREQPFIDFAKSASLKHSEMVDLVRRNNLKIDDLEDPMQKLAFTFFSEIGEMSHEAEVIIDESIRSQQEAGHSKDLGVGTVTRE